MTNEAGAAGNQSVLEKWDFMCTQNNFEIYRNFSAVFGKTVLFYFNFIYVSFCQIILNNTVLKINPDHFAILYYEISKNKHAIYMTNKDSLNHKHKKQL